MFRLDFGTALAAVLALAVSSGCGGSTSAYIPNAATARDVLDSALSTWAKGGKADGLSIGETAVHFVDGRWAAGEELESFRILDDEPAAGAETEKRFSVALKMKKPPGDQRVEYVAVGRSPMWIFRDSDYEKQVSMGEEAKAKAKPRRPARER